MFNLKSETNLPTEKNNQSPRSLVAQHQFLGGGKRGREIFEGKNEKACKNMCTNLLLLPFYAKIIKPGLI